MDKITISNLQGENGLVNVVRYFQNNGQEYIIYSLNEVDEAGYTRLYVAKIKGVDGTYSAETLNDNEWNEVKNLVKLIVKANKEGMPVPVQDLNAKKISNLLLKDKKVFKLNAPLVNDLSANKPNFDTESSSNTVTQNSLFNTPTFEQPIQQPTFDIPSTPTFEQPAQQPTFDIPSTPTFEQPVQQPTFDIPSAPAFEQPVQQPTFDIPSTPAFEQPVQQPAFDIPSTPAFEQPVQQPTFDIPSAPAFEQPVQQSAFDFTNMQNNGMPFGNNTQNTNPTEDYKQMYQDILEKNNELQEQINKINAELVQYKEIINNIKSIVEK